MKKRFCYDYPRPMVTVDVVVFGLMDNTLSVLLIERGNDPYKGFWALPGGFVQVNEDLKPAAMRELEEETGVRCENIYQFMTVGTPGRDPRGHVISVIYTGFFDACSIPRHGDDAENVRWFAPNDVPDLAFDHGDILVQVWKRWNTILKHPENIVSRYKFPREFVNGFDDFINK
jgi:8-oxo-dGTP diphosphatase